MRPSLALAVVALAALSAPAPAQTEPQQGQSQKVAPPNGKPLASPQHQSQAEQNLQTKSGQNAKQEPTTKPAADNKDPVLVNGRLNVPGAPVDSQTVPAKFSEGNAALDKRPIMAFPLTLSDEQKQKLLAMIRAAKPDAPVAKIDPKLTEELPASVQLHDLPPSANELGVSEFKYVRVSDGILLVRPANRIVVAEIKG
jgi:hypothetical protein